MPGQYTKFRGTLPAFTPEPEYQERVEVKKTELGGENATEANLNHLIGMYRSIKTKKEALEECETRACGQCLFCYNLMLEAIRQIATEAMIEQGMEKVGLAEGGSVFIQDTPYPQVEDREKLREWIVAGHMEEMLTVHWQTLKSLCAEHLIKGEEPPPGVTVYLKTELRVRAK